ncbi:divalent metal cation transporter [Mesorhizobium argentiipisi]|uniref:Divalent metal cation transporter n=1 Tax=Mesorhizobium argentiipisi TaxID=3015175 RepID=A0ABU8KKC5_9HYPH
MTFSNLIMYFIILSTGSTLHKAGQTQIETAAQAAEALRPLAGDAAGILFAAGVIGVGFLAVPIMTTGAAFDLAQAMGWKHGMNHAGCGWAQLSWFQSNASAGLGRHRARLFHASASAAGSSDDQRSQDHGRQGQQPQHEHPRRRHDHPNLCGLGRPGGELVPLTRTRLSSRWPKGIRASSFRIGTIIFVTHCL